jgi:hypothetical protein
VEHSQPTQPISGAAAHTHGNVARGRSYKPWFLLILVAGLGIAIYNGLLAWTDPGPSPVIDGVVTIDGLTNSIASGAVTYDQHPPAGGAHAAVTQQCGLYRVPVNDANAVASLATGAVWLAFNPNLPEDKIEILQGFARGKLDVILAPYVGLPADTGVVLTAWGRQLTLTPDQIPDPRIVRFIDVYSNGDQAPDRNADCLGGVGVP